MKKPAMDLHISKAKALREWRKWRRIHAARAPNERRLLVLAAVAVVWFLTDTVLVTPTLEKLKTVSARHAKAQADLVTRQTDTARQSNDMVAMTRQLQGEVDRLKQLIAQQKRDIDAFQGGLVPANDMHNVLQGLLDSQGDVRLVSMKTLSQEEARKAMPNVQDTQDLYRHGLEVRMQGSFHHLLAWLTSAEQLPRRLLWSDMRLELNDKQQLFLTVRLFTLSRDAMPLEIAGT